MKGLMDLSSFWKLMHRKTASQQMFRCVLGTSEQPGMGGSGRKLCVFNFGQLGVATALGRGLKSFESDTRIKGLEV
jgi:hypothetical protein